MANTLNYGFPKPDIANNIDEEFYVFRDTTLDMIDAAIKAVADSASAKAALVHSHEIGDVTGLAGALAGKMSADTTFSLDSLTDVDGAAGAAVNSVLVKNSSGLWVPSSALAALGPHGHTISEITGLGDALVSKADGSAVAAALGLKADKAVTVTGAGLATGGGDLSGNRTITVTKATDAEAEARTRDDVALTPLTGGKMAAARDGRLLHVRDQKAGGVQGGASVTGDNNRVLNTVVFNGIAGASLASNIITLPAGVYDICGSAPSYKSGTVWTRIARVSDGVQLLRGTSDYGSPVTGDFGGARNTIVGRITLLVQTDIRVITNCATAKSADGLGVGDSNSPVFTDIMIWKVD